MGDDDSSSPFGATVKEPGRLVERSQVTMSDAPAAVCFAFCMSGPRGPQLRHHRQGPSDASDFGGRMDRRIGAATIARRRLTGFFDMVDAVSEAAAIAGRPMRATAYGRFFFAAIANRAV